MDGQRPYLRLLSCFIFSAMVDANSDAAKAALQNEGKGQRMKYLEMKESYNLSSDGAVCHVMASHCWTVGRPHCPAVTD